jgi:MFS family permease
LTDSISRPVRAASSLLLSTAFLLSSIGLLGILIPVRGTEAGFNEALLGALAGVYYVGFLIGTFVIPALVRRIGHIRAFAFGATCAASVALLHALSVSPALWLALRLVDGVMMVGLYTIIESWLNAIAPARHRGTIFALYMMMNSGGLAFSQLLLRVGGAPFMLFSVSARLACAAVLPVVLTHQPQPALQAAPRLRLPRLFKLAPAAGAGALLAGLGSGAFFGLGPVYAMGLGLDTDGVSLYMMVAILGGALLQTPLGYGSDHIDRRLAMACVALAACVLACTMVLSSSDHRAELILIFLYCGMSFAIYPMSVAHLVDHLSPDELLGASSSVYFLYGLGSVFGPLVVGLAMTQIGARALPIWFALVAAALALYAAYRYRVFRRTQVRDRPFTPMMQTTRTVMEAAAVAREEPGSEHRSGAGR